MSTSPPAIITSASIMTTLPSRMITPPSRMITSPSHMIASPSHMIASPSHMIASPSHMIASPSHMIASPSHMIASPSHMLTSPSRMTAPVASGSCSYHSSDDENNVLDLRKYKMPDERLTPPVSPPPLVSPVLAVTQRVLAAVNSPNTRPFKAYPKNPLSVNPTPEYARYLDEVLPKLHSTKGSSRKRPSSPKESLSGKESPEQGSPHKGERNAAYWERRKKNNEAAKRSRDLRRAKEDELAIHAAVLEEENLKLKCQVDVLSKENVQLKSMMYHHTDHLQPHHMFTPPPMAFMPRYSSLI